MRTFLLLFLVVPVSLAATPLQWTAQIVNDARVPLGLLRVRDAWPSEGRPRLTAWYPAGWGIWRLHLSPFGTWETQKGSEGQLDWMGPSVATPGTHSLWLLFVSPSGASRGDSFLASLEHGGWKTRDALLWLKAAEWSGLSSRADTTRMPLLYSGSYRDNPMVDASSLEPDSAVPWFVIRYDWTR